MTALSLIRIRNYRCFLDHTIDFGATTVVVGRNNAGKSTLIEALKLVSSALLRFRNPVAAQAPDWLDDWAPGQGQRLDLRRLGVVHETLFHRYGEAPAIVEARFEDGSQLTLYAGPEGVCHTIFNTADGTVVRRRGDLRTALPSIAILPQTSPLEREERVLNSDYVTDHLASHLASRHFRNQLMLLYDDYFDRFVALVEESWRSVRIDGLDRVRQDDGEILRLMVRDGNFVAEVGWMGHGLQMWLQTIWFVTRTATSSTLVLDEPDVYMHPDLQRKLVRFLAKQNRQLIIATHSTEILAEVDAKNVLILDRDQQRSTFATDLPAVQRVVESLGSSQNLQIARLWRARVLILVEGDDMRVLRRVHDLVFPDSATGFDTYPNWSIGGWSGWANAVGSAAALRNSVDEAITCYCIFDSDYHLQREKEARYAQADQAGIELHIFRRKEIENYLLVPSLVQRVISSLVPNNQAPPTFPQVQTKIEEICTGLLDQVGDSFATAFSLENRGMAAGTAAARAREHVRAASERPGGRIALVPGKEALSALSQWSREVFHVSFGVTALLRMMRRDDVDAEMVQLVSAISRAVPFPREIR